MNEKPKKPFRISPWWFVLVVVAGIAWWAWPKKARSGGATFAAKRGPLDISVMTGGSIEALESQEVRSEVRGEAVKILKLVDEGYTVTEEDVRTNRILVELDAAKLKQQLVNQDITFQTTLSGLTEAQQAYEIQFNQNRVDVKAAEQKAKFAYMDMEKFLGDRIGQELVERLDLRETINTNLMAAIETGDVPDPEPQTNAPPALSMKPKVVIDYSAFAKAELLGDGGAKQQLRKLEDELLVSRTEHGQASTKLEGTKRLHEKGFVTKTELENELINADKARLKVDSAQVARDLFIKYEFPKQAEEFVSKYDEALRGLERARKEAVAKLAQARAKQRSAESRYRIEKENRDELQEQIAKCVITAKKTGMVVYGGGDDSWRWGGNEPIRVGSQVYERQAIVTIPDTTSMGVKLSVHESHIKKVARGLSARVTADAFPDEKLMGEVSKVGVLPDSRNRWSNPELKLYQCTIKLTDRRPWLKPGMSAKVEILVKQIPDVIYVPMQAVVTRNGRQVVFLAGAGSGSLEREVKVGEFNDEFIEIREGLKENEKVLLKIPDEMREAGETAEKSPGLKKEEKPAPKNGARP